MRRDNTIRSAARNAILDRERLRGLPGMVAYLFALWSLDDTCHSIERFRVRGMPDRAALRFRTRALIDFDRRVNGRAYLP